MTRSPHNTIHLLRIHFLTQTLCVWNRESDGSWSFLSTNEPVKNGCEVIYEMFHILNCGFKMKHFIYHFTNVQVYQYRRIVMYRKKY